MFGAESEDVTETDLPDRAPRGGARSLLHVRSLLLVWGLVGGFVVVDVFAS